MHFVLQDIEALVHIGITPTEQAAPQLLSFTIAFNFEASVAAQSDDITDTVDYQVLYDTVKKVTQLGRWNLLESLHAEMLTALKSACPLAENLTLQITKKPWPHGRITVS